MPLGPGPHGARTAGPRVEAETARRGGRASRAVASEPPHEAEGSEGNDGALDWRASFGKVEVWSSSSLLRLYPS